jgi:2,3-bisphosphoglycerate-dependent phosphoglycerate mutase
MQFYFIRHGQSENNLLWLRTGAGQGRSEDPDLTSVGRQQAQRVARFLKRVDPAVADDFYGRDVQNVTGFGLTHLYTSLMLRAVATGTMIAQALGLPLVGWKDLHETGGIFLDDGDSGERVGLPGKNRAYFESHFPNLALPDDLGDEGWWNRPFEEYEDRPLRAQRVLRELLERHGGTDDRVAVVSHGGFFYHLLRVVLSLPEDDAPWLSMNNTAITRIDFDKERVSLCYLNRVDFLPRELIT